MRLSVLVIDLGPDGMYWVTNSPSKTSRSAKFSSNFKSFEVLFFSEVIGLSQSRCFFPQSCFGVSIRYCINVV